MNTNSFNPYLTDIISLAAKYPSIKRVGVFGSFAKGSNTENSDLDLLYDYDDTKENSTDELLEYVDEIDTLLRTSVQVPKIDYVWYNGVIKSDNTNFKNEVLNSVVWVYTAF